MLCTVLTCCLPDRRPARGSALFPFFTAFFPLSPALFPLLLSCLFPVFHCFVPSLACLVLPTHPPPSLSTVRSAPRLFSDATYGIGRLAYLALLRIESTTSRRGHRCSCTTTATRTWTVTTSCRYIPYVYKRCIHTARFRSCAITRVGCSLNGCVAVNRTKTIRSNSSPALILPIYPLTSTKRTQTRAQRPRCIELLRLDRPPPPAASSSPLSTHIHVLNARSHTGIHHGDDRHRPDEVAR